MTRTLGLLALALGGLGYAVPDASACHRSRSVACYVHCEPYWPCPPCHHHHCYCIAFRDPYALTGALWVRCESCHDWCGWHHCPHPYTWHWCYVFATGRHEWVKIRRCYPYGTPYDKEAEGAEGFQKAAAEMPGLGSIAVTVAPGAKLTYDGVAADDSTDTVRHFQTSTLAPGQVGTFTFVAEYGEGDRRTVVRREVTVRAWGEVTVDLTGKPDASVASK